MSRKYITSLFVFVCHNIFATNVLFNSSRSDYSIMISGNASESEKTAAAELQEYLFEISRAKLPIVKNENTAMGKYIVVGWNKGCGEACPEDDSEQYTYKSVGDDLYIWGGKQKGTMYGVFAFLENELGVRWYTPEFTKVPKRKSFVYTDIYHSETPFLDKRQVLYYKVTQNPSWSAHNRLNCEWSVRKNKYGGLSAIFGAHKLPSLVPEAIFYSKHPEYYALNKGKRNGKGQLCLSNPKLRKIVADTLRIIMKNNPDYWAYDVSQGDNNDFCECSKCKAIEDKYGTHSGLILWFVNQVADDIRKEFPNKYLSTFAYRGTRLAPTGIRPRSNVVIRLCNIECCFVHSLNTCKQNLEFVSDLKAWSNLTDKLFIWDYATCFPHYLLPVPNFNVLAHNINIFKDNGCIGIMSEGEHNGEWGEFSELKAWLLAKLMWNPKANTEQLANEFIKDYYGKGAKIIQEYYTSLNAQIREDTHLAISWRDKEQYKSVIFSNSFINKNIESLEKAVAITKKEPETQKRINRVLAQLYYVKTVRNKPSSVKDGTLKKLERILKDDPTIINEQKLTFDEYAKQFQFI